MKDLNPVAEALVLKFGNSARGLFTWIGCKSLSKKCADFVQFEEFCYMVSFLFSFYYFLLIRSSSYRNF